LIGFAVDILRIHIQLHNLTNRAVTIMNKLMSLLSDGFGLVTIASIIWGTIGIATQVIYNLDSSTSPLFINLMRTLIATPILLFISWHIVGRNMFRIQRRDFTIMCMMGIFLALSQVAYFSSIRYVGVTISTLLTLCTPPILVALVSVVFKLDTFNRQIVIALICAMIGCVLLVGVNPSDNMPNLELGTLYALASAVCYAGMLICGRFLAAQYHPLQITAIGFSASTILLLLMMMVSDVAVIQTSQGWGLVIYLGLIPTAFAYWIFQVGLRSVPATTASIVVMIDPLVAACLAWVLFDERLTITGIIGSGFLILSLLLLAFCRKA